MIEMRLRAQGGGPVMGGDESELLALGGAGIELVSRLQFPSSIACPCLSEGSITRASTIGGCPGPSVNGSICVAM
jgi:hypothetical protein